MELQPSGEYGPVRVDQMLFHSVRAGGTGGKPTAVDAALVVVVPVARLCSALGAEVTSWDSCDAVFEPDTVLD